MRKIKRLGVLESGAGIGDGGQPAAPGCAPEPREPVVFVPARGALNGAGGRHDCVGHHSARTTSGREE